MKQTYSLTEGKILSSLMRFAVPVFFTLFLQALYGGVDLLVVGQFAQTADVSAVIRIIDTGGSLLAEIDRYTSLYFKRSWQGVGDFQFVLPRQTIWEVVPPQIILVPSKCKSSLTSFSSSALSTGGPTIT